VKNGARQEITMDEYTNIHSRSWRCISRARRIVKNSLSIVHKVRTASTAILVNASLNRTSCPGSNFLRWEMAREAWEGSCYR